MKNGGSIISDSPHMTAPAQSSAPQNTSVGSGSRPTKSMVKIETSAPSNGMTLGRAPSGYLK